MGTRSHSYRRAVFFVLAVSFFGCQRSVTQSVMPVEDSGEPKFVVDPWPTQVASVAELEKLGMFPVEWKWFEPGELRIAIAVENRTMFSPSHHLVCGYVYNKHLDGWTRFLASNLECVGNVVISIDDQKNCINILGDANDDLKGKLIISFSLEAITDSAPYQSR